MKIGKRLLSLLLCCILVFMAMSGAASAKEQESTSIQENNTKTSETKDEISYKKMPQKFVSAANASMELSSISSTKNVRMASDESFGGKTISVEKNGKVMKRLPQIGQIQSLLNYMLQTQRIRLIRSSCQKMM